jgi:hypothetical protein
VKNLMMLCLLLPLGERAFSQHWQQQADYFIDVQLNDSAKTLDGFARIRYTNASPDTLRFLWFHLWPNAYKHDRTAFSDQLLANGNTRFYFSGPGEKGYINRLHFKAGGQTARTEDHPEHIDILKVFLPEPLAPGDSVTLTTPFHVKLPFNVSRGGYWGRSFQVSQWYPKVAVYDQKGWHPLPYLDQGEFYGNFGNYEVQITLPSGYVVAATGALQDSSEQEWLRTRPLPQPLRKTAKPVVQQRESGMKTLRFRQAGVHDFAWFANERFIVKQDTCALPSGRVVKVASYYTPEEAGRWGKSLDYAKEALRFYSSQVGDYPYNTLSIVQGPPSFSGGMEYPTITLVAPIEEERELEATIVHEVGHNWFYGVLASNEREHPWMDEGLNTFYERKYLQAKYRKQPQTEELFFRTKADRKRDQPILTPSAEFSPANYGLVAYYKTAEWMALLEEKLGEARFRLLMQDYYRQWSFRHPQPADFLQLVGTALGSDSTRYIALLQKKGTLPKEGGPAFSVVSPFKKGSIDNYLRRPAKNILFLSPAIGFNSYDKLLVGAIVSNYKLPPSRFQYLLVPMLGTGSGELTGLGRLSYTLSSEGLVRKTDFFLAAARFSMNDFRDTAGKRLLMQFAKLAPGFRLTLREPHPRSTLTRYLQWKTFLISEESLRIRPDTLINGGDTALLTQYATPSAQRYLNQLRLVVENHRALYPYSVQLQVEQSTDFLRPALTANYYFNYPKEGGLQVRFFAGAFIYLNGKDLSKQFANDRYHLNLTGANGYEDYTYSDYFIGRNRFEGFASQQLMIRDGGFKVRTDLLASKVGKTDEWLMALNLNTSVPQHLNPLSVLPVKIPLRIFADLGTYADSWKAGATGDRFLYDIGLHLPLFRESLNIYIPLLYSKVYGDYFKSTLGNNRFFKTISFNINLFNRDLQALNREIEF